MSALAERTDEENAVGPLGPPVPRDIQQKIDRGWAAAKKDANLRRLCHKFWEGDHYWYQNAQGALRFLTSALVDVTGGKPSHRIRNTYNFIQSIIEGKVSAATQRVPGYEVDPSSADNEDRQAARIAEQVAYYGEDKWYLRRMATKVVTLALVQREGFAMPYFDGNLGPFKDGQGLGDIRVAVFSRSEVMWEPGEDFLDSRWHAIRQAVMPEVIEAIPGYMGGKLIKDASTADIPGDKATPEKVLLTTYMERPSKRYPDGRRCFIANNRVVVDYRKDPTAPEDADWYEPHPYMDADGNVADEPVLHRLSYTVNPEGDDMGLVERLIDLMRTVNDCVAGDTLVQTINGLRSARELAGQEVLTLTGDGTYRPAKWSNYGERQLWKVTLDNGEELFASERHEWIINAPGKGNTRRVHTPDLLGERIPLVSRRPNFEVPDQELWEAGVRNGLVYGDGTVANHKRADGSLRSYGRLTQYTEDGCDLAERFFPDECGNRRDVDGRVQVTTRGLSPKLKQIPSVDEHHDYLRGFLAGALAADGGVNTRGAVRLFSADRGDLQVIAQIARTLGIVVTSIRKERDGTAYKADAELFSLGLSKAAFVNEAGVDRSLIIRDYHAEMLGVGPVRMTTRRVVAVEKTERVEETFCCVEPVTRSWVTGSGVLTSNCWNKLLEWKNRTLMPRWSAPRGSEFKTNDVPGGIDFYRPQGTLKPEQERPMPVPRELFEMLNMAVSQMRELASDINAQPEPDLAAKTLNVAVEQAALRWQSFLGDYAEFRSRVMRHCLTLVQRYYTEERLIPIRGQYGSEPILAFKGMDLRSQTNVRVLPGSVESKSRAQTMREIEFIQQNWPGALSPEAAMAALHGGNAESLLKSYTYDVDRAWKLVQALRKGPDAMLGFQERVDFDMGDPMLGFRVPGWMPRVQDNTAIWKAVVGDYTKSDDFDHQPQETQHMFDLVYKGLEALEKQKAMNLAMQSQSAAAELGQANAAKPQGELPMPQGPQELSPAQAAA